MAEVRGITGTRAWVRMTAVVLLAPWSLTACGGLAGSAPAGSTAAASGVAPGAPSLPPPAPGDPSAPRSGVDPGWRVSRVVDGDTVWVTRDGRRLKVRLIGIDTPETVAPGEPVGCFGPQSSDFAARLLLGTRVGLEYDPGQGMTDAYDRTLAYVWTQPTPDGGPARLFNYDAIRQGYARQYLYDEAYAWYPEFVAAEAAARDEGLGLWSACPDLP